jgi:hypothetical protein
VDSVLPWGMPWVMVWKDDAACCVCRDCVRLLRYDMKKATDRVEKLNSSLSLSMSLVWDMVSYALLRST